MFEISLNAWKINDARKATSKIYRSSYEIQLSRYDQIYLKHIHTAFLLQQPTVDQTESAMTAGWSVSSLNTKSKCSMLMQESQSSQDRGCRCLLSWMHGGSVGPWCPAAAEHRGCIATFSGRQAKHTQKALSSSLNFVALHCRQESAQYESAMHKALVLTNKGLQMWQDIWVVPHAACNQHDEQQWTVPSSKPVECSMQGGKISRVRIR